MDGKINLNIKINVVDAIDAILNCLDRRQLIDLIKEIDSSIQDWDFTLELADHFDLLRQEWENEQDKDALAKVRL